MGIKQGRGRRGGVASLAHTRLAAPVLLGLILVIRVSAATAATTRIRPAVGTASEPQTGQQIRLVGVLLGAGGGSPTRLSVGTTYSYQVDVIPIRHDLARMPLAATAPPQTNPRLVFRFLGLATWARIGTTRGSLGRSVCLRRFHTREVRLSNGQAAIDFGTCSMVRLSFTPTRPGYRHFMVEADAVTISHGTYRLAGRQGNSLTWSGVVKR